MGEEKQRVGAGLWGKHIRKRQKEGNQVEKRKSSLIILTKEGRIPVRIQ